jgi:hypothetical protein
MGGAPQDCPGEVKRCELCGRDDADTFVALMLLVGGSGRGRAAACHSGCEAMWIFEEMGLWMVYRLACGHHCCRHHAGHRCCRCREGTAPRP